MFFALEIRRDGGTATVVRGQKPEYENYGLSLSFHKHEAYAGHVGKAWELTKRAVDSAIRADSRETGAIWQANAALDKQLILILRKPGSQRQGL